MSIAVFDEYSLLVGPSNNAIYLNWSVTVPHKHAGGNLRVAFAMAPMRTEGTAMMIQPKAATYDRICALPADLLESTLWKYTCNSRDRRACGMSDMLRCHE